MSKTHSQVLNKITSRMRTRKVGFSEAVRMKEKLKSHLSALEKAYEKNYISKEAYEKGKDKIRKVYKTFKDKYL